MRLPWRDDFASYPEPLKDGIRAIAARRITLEPSEAKWRDKYSYLESRGYRLRPRYHPSWVAAWTLPENANLDPSSFEDHIRPPPRGAFMDATRISDGRLVYVKSLRTDSNELRIAKLLYGEDIAMNARNHCVPVLDAFEDEADPNVSYLIMPFLRPIDRPPFATIGDVVDFVSQALEGLTFIHDHNVAHRDCAYRNVMMDADCLYPEGYHPVLIDFNSTGEHEVRPLPRSTGQIRYYYIDFGLSVHIPPGQPRSVVGGNGQDQAPPELSFLVPYDPFKLDIFIIGNLLKTMFHATYGNVEFLEPLVKAMTQEKPANRPDAATAEKQWLELKAKVSPGQLNWRLRSRAEVWPQTIALDGWVLLGHGARAGKRLFSWVSDMQG